MEAIILQYISASNQHIVRLKPNTMLHVHYSSIKLEEQVDFHIPYELMFKWIPPCMQTPCSNGMIRVNRDVF